MLKALFLTHRYLGIFLGVLMVVWCLSGFIMMYKSYPELTETDLLSLLPTFSNENCCTELSLPGLDEQEYQQFHLQMLEGMPVLHLEVEDGRLITIDLKHNRVFHSIQTMFAEQMVDEFSLRSGYPDAQLESTIHNDQWTVYGAYDPHRPLYQVNAHDPVGTQWYLSSRTGEIVQLTTREERVWGFLGAVIHWLYPTILREKVTLWSQTVIWLTIIGIFLTATGLFFGLRQYKQRQSGRMSPYQGLSFWHHYSGLLFGVLTFSWVLSGLFSMQPWGLMEGEGVQSEQAMLRGGSINWQTINSILPTIEDIQLPVNTVKIEGSLLQGQLALYSVSENGNKFRFSPDKLEPLSLDENRLQELAAALSPEGMPIEAGMLYEEDSYFYNHHVAVQLPAYRVIANDGKRTHFYLDPVNGKILDKIDTEDKWYRWLHYGLHRGDFTLFLRSRPAWDIFMWVLLLGVTSVCITGMCMGFRRLQRGL
jgi:hypothetical protein